mmetsp:Transcript_38608/g.84612  ORF Transcript_38608/g.84612 Transcript_38608/m.84612 type:complete len:292 (+) Transcript_38608:2780-3655(+)
MASATTQAIAGSLLLAGGAYVAPAFVPAAIGQTDAGASSQLRGAAAGVAGEGQTQSSFGAMVPVSMGALALAAYSQGRQRRTTATRRRFFGDAPAPTTKKAETYKDFADPWLGSADLGFDPLNLAVQGGIFDKAETAVPETTYYNYRESEVKHGRFAMGAFLAIFAESADRGALFKQLGQTGIEDKLDGTLGLDEVQAPVLLIGLGYQALAEYNLQRDETDGNILSVQYKKERLPGDLGFDPLGLSKGKGSDIKGLHNIEVNSGRLAMIGVTSFLFKEFLVKDPEIASKIL